MDKFADAFKRTIYCMIAFGLFLVFMPNLPPYDVEFHGLFEVDGPGIKFEGNLEPNQRLENAEPISRRVIQSSIGYIKVLAILINN
jgi:hypothetical protein